MEGNLDMFFDGYQADFQISVDLIHVIILMAHWNHAFWVID